LLGLTLRGSLTLRFLLFNQKVEIGLATEIESDSQTIVDYEGLFWLELKSQIDTLPIEGILFVLFPFNTKNIIVLKLLLHNFFNITTYERFMA